MERTLRAQRCCIVTLLLTTAALTAACQNSTNLSDLADESANGYTQRSDSDADGQDISIGSFNMLRLGSGSKNIGRLAAVIDKARYDIFAAQEIMNPDGAQELLQALRGATGHDWRMVLSASANGESTYKEYNGFYFRADVVEPLLAQRAYCRSSQGVERVENACFVRDSEEAVFERDPFVGHFTIHGMPVSLVSVHLIYGDSIERRQDESIALRAVMDDVRQKTPHSHVFVLGDFNLTVVNDDDAPAPALPRYVAEAMPEEVFSDGHLVNGIFDGPTTVGASSYDHILYYEDSSSVLVPRSAKVVSDIDIHDDEQRALYKAEVSDHYAITARFRIH